MESVLCPNHGRPCALKTGTQPGKNYGASFYMCLVQKCGFVQRTKRPPIICPVHNEMVGLRVLNKGSKVVYRCSQSSSRNFCGQMTSQEMKENINPHPVKQVPSSKPSTKRADTSGSPSSSSDIVRESECKAATRSDTDPPCSTSTSKRKPNLSHNDSPQASPQAVTSDDSPAASPQAVTSDDSPEASPQGVTSNSSPETLPQAVTSDNSPAASPQAVTSDDSPQASPQAVTSDDSPEASPQAVTSDDSPEASPQAVTSDDSPQASPQAVTSDDSPQASPQAVTSDDSPQASPQAVTSDDSPEALLKAATSDNSHFSESPGSHIHIAGNDSSGGCDSCKDHETSSLTTASSYDGRGTRGSGKKSSLHYIPEAPTDVSSLFSDEEDISLAQKRKSLALLAGGSPTLKSPVSLDRSEKTEDNESFSDIGDGDGGSGENKASEDSESDHTCSSMGAASPVSSADRSWEEEEEEKKGESDLEEGSKMSDCSRESEMEEDTDKVVAKSFTTYRTTYSTSGDTDSGEEEDSEDESSIIKKTEFHSSLVSLENSPSGNGECGNSSFNSNTVSVNKVTSFDGAHTSPSPSPESPVGCEGDEVLEASGSAHQHEASEDHSCSGTDSHDNDDIGDSPTPVSTPQTAVEQNSDTITHSRKDTHVGLSSQHDINSLNRCSLESTNSPAVVLLEPVPKPKPRLSSGTIDSPIDLSPAVSLPRLSTDTHKSLEAKTVSPTSGLEEEAGCSGAMGRSPDGGEADIEEKEVVKTEPQFKVGYQYRNVIKQLMETEMFIQTMSHKLPDGGASLRQRKEALLARIEQLKRPAPDFSKPLPAGPDIQLHNKNRLTYQAKMLTAGTVEQLHSTLSNCPTEDTLADTPSGFKVELMRHQRRALAWMLWREAQKPSAGILADDMGLGKTLSLLSLVMKKKDEGVRDWLAQPPAREGLVKCAGTLVVCPASLMMQWAEEVKSKLRPHALSVNVYHGSNRTGFAHDLASYDLVVTTYNIVGIEGESCQEDDPMEQSSTAKPKKKKRTTSTTTLFKVHWRRVILDEAHVIRNHKTALSLGACKLESDFRWAITGTPIQNKLKDFYSLIKFIRLAPFDDYRVWRDTVERKGSLGMKRLDTVVSSLVLRRTKEDLDKSTLSLTQRNVTSHTIQLLQEEKQVYDILFAEARKVMCSWLQEQGEDVHVSGPREGDPKREASMKEETDGQSEEEKKPVVPIEVERLVNSIIQPYLIGSSKGRCVLGLLLRLRQCCCHLSLLTSALHRNESDQDDLDLELAMGGLSLGEGGHGGGGEEDGGRSGRDRIPSEFATGTRSTKVLEVLRELKRISAKNEDPPEKSVIVSQWTSMLDIMQQHLDRAGITHVRIDGTIPPAKRLERVSSFNQPTGNPTVMLLSLQAGGVGLNLIGGNHIFMLDMHWNPALETQAGDRCHRMGQKRDVFIHKFVCEGTVEERILMLQKKKLELAQSVLDGASERGRARFKGNNGLTLNDLKLLFEIQ